MEKRIVTWPSVFAFYLGSKVIKSLDYKIRNKRLLSKTRNNLVGSWEVECYEVDGISSIENKNSYSVGEGIEIVLSIRNDNVYSFDFICRDNIGGLKLYPGRNSGLADWVSSIDLISSIGCTGYWTFLRKQGQLYFSGNFHSSRMQFVFFPLKTLVPEIHNGKLKLQFMKRGRLHAIIFKSIY